jgi:general secretion pathway protein D
MPKQTLLFRALALAALFALPSQAQDAQAPAVNVQPGSQPPRRVPPGRNLNRPTQRNAQEAQQLNSRGGNGARQLPHQPQPQQQDQTGGSSFNASRVRPAPAQTAVGQDSNAPTAMTQPPARPPIDHNDVRKNARTVILSFDKRDLTELIQFVSQELGRNFILPERVGGKVTLLSNAPVPIDEVWNVFVAALDANNWSLYQVGHYWKLVEKKQSPRTNIPTMLQPGEEAASTEQMVTKLFKLKYVEADQMRNVLNFFISKDADLQIFPPDTLIISDLGLNMRRLDHLIEQLDVPGGSEEIHIVSVQYAAAQELAQKLTEIFQAQQTGSKTGGPRQIGVAEPIQPVQPGQLGGVFAQNQASSGGPVQVSKIIAEERTNKLIVIAGGKSFARVAELIKQLDVPSSEGGVHVYYLENAKAEDVAATMQSLAQGLSSSASGSRGRVPGAGATAPVPAPGGASSGAASAELFSGQVKITADKNTNSLVVIASQADYRNLVKVVERLDIRRRQVFVEAVIMEVNLENDTDFGVSAHGGELINNVNFRGTQGSAPLVVGSELGGLSSLGGISSLASLGGFLAGIQGPAITVAGVSIPSFSIVLNALQSSSDVNVISTPHVIMTDNTEGEITVGQNVPFQAGYTAGSSLGGIASTLGAAGTTGANGGLGNTAALLGGLGGLTSGLIAPIQRQNVELRLRIKPQINESDFVRLEVDEQTEEIASVDKTLGPTTSKRTAKTTVVAKDQETVVIGGMIQDRVTKSVQKIPVLGSLPLLGWLFRNESTKKQKTNLLLFLTPYIIRDQSDYRRIFERKMAERAEFVKRFYGDETNYETPVDYTRKLGPLSRLRRGVDFELSKAENGGSGAVGERIIGPSQRYVPPQMDTGSSQPAPAPSPAPLPAEPSRPPAPGKQDAATSTTPPERETPEPGTAAPKPEEKPQEPNGVVPNSPNGAQKDSPPKEH